MSTPHLLPSPLPSLTLTKCYSVPTHSLTGRSPTTSPSCTTPTNFAAATTRLSVRPAARPQCRRYAGCLARSASYSPWPNGPTTLSSGSWPLSWTTPAKQKLALETMTDRCQAKKSLGNLAKKNLALETMTDGCQAEISLGNHD